MTSFLTRMSVDVHIYRYGFEWCNGKQGTEAVAISSIDQNGLIASHTIRN